MENFTITFSSFLLLFFCLQTADAQHFEKNWQSRDREGILEIEASKVDDGWVTVVGEFGKYEVIKYDAQGNEVWSYFPSGFDFWVHSSYTFTALESGNYLLTVQGSECDFCVHTGLILLNENGRVLKKDTITNPQQSLGCEGFWSVDQLTDSTLWMFGRDYFWEFNLNTFRGNAVLYEELGFDKRPSDAWVGKNGLVYLAYDQMHIFNRHRTKVDSFELENGFDFGIPMTNSSHLIRRSSAVEIIDNSGKVLHSWQAPADEYYYQAKFVENKIILLGARFSDFTAIFNRFDLDLTNQERFEWGTNFLQTADFAVQDTVVLIGGEELSFFGIKNYFTPFFKTLSWDDFSTSDYQKEAALESIAIDSLIGEVTGEFVDPDSTIWVNTAMWKFHNLNIVVKNNGTETLNKIKVNWEGKGIPCADLLNSRSLTVNLLPGLDTLISLGDLFDSEIGTELPDNIKLCIWLSTPDNLLDADNTNDFVCETFNLKNITSTNNIFTSNDLEIFPNPSSDFLNIDFKNTELTDSKIQVVDPLGRVVFSDKNERGVYSKSLNISNLSKGIYFLILKNEKGKVVKRWVKG